MIVTPLEIGDRVLVDIGASRRLYVAGFVVDEMNGEVTVRLSHPYRKEEPTDLVHTTKRHLVRDTHRNRSRVFTSDYGYFNELLQPGFDHVFYDGDEYELQLNGGTGACWNCGTITRFYSISFIASLCSTMCADKKWEEYFEAERKAPKETEGQ